MGFEFLCVYRSRVSTFIEFQAWLWKFDSQRFYFLLCAWFFELSIRNFYSYWSSGLGFGNSKVRVFTSFDVVGF